VCNCLNISFLFCARHDWFHSVPFRSIPSFSTGFRTRGKQLLESGEFSNQWFHGFKKRYNICLRRPTHKAQAVPSSKRQLIRSFHRDIRAKAAIGNQLGSLGRFRLSCIANVDQTPLPFTFTNGPTYRPLNSHDLVVRHTISTFISRPLVDLTISHDFQQNFQRHTKSPYHVMI